MIKALKGFPPKVLVFSWKGHVTKHDYEERADSRCRRSTQAGGQRSAFYQIDADFSGFERVKWDDFKVGTEHLARWERIAVVTDLEWIGYTFRAFSFVIPGVVKVFRVDEKAKARKWILEDMTQ